MQKIVIFTAATILLILLLCYGCGPDRAEESIYAISNVADISFVWVDHDGTVTIEESLDTTLFSAFLADFSKLSDHTYWNDPIDWIYGSAVMISFHDGSYHMINHYCTMYCDGDNVDDTRQYYGAEAFEAFWIQYCGCEYRHD